MKEPHLPTNATSGDTSTQHNLLTVKEAASRLRISTWMVYKLVNERKLSTVKIGRRRLVPVEAIEAAIERMASETAA